MEFTLKILLVLLGIACMPSGHSGVLPMQPVAIDVKGSATAVISTPPTLSMEKKILWVTDMHLNALNRDAFIRSIRNDTHEAIFMTGDIADGDLIEALREIADCVAIPIYFVLGNSDNAYGSRTKEVRRNLDELMKEKSNIHYLYDTAVYFKPRNMLTEVKTAVVGMDGYADSWDVSETQRNQDLATFESNVQNAIVQGAKRIVILTHVPPFMTDCWYRGELTSAENAAHYSSAHSARILLDLANKHPDVKFIVYCGHTHSSSYQAYPNGALDENLQRKPNLLVYVGGKFSASSDALGKGNSAGMYRLNRNSFLPDSFEFTRSGKTSVL